jgi:hypothetical protein
MIVHCWSVRSMPVRYDGSTVTVHEITSSVDKGKHDPSVVEIRLINSSPHTITVYGLDFDMLLADDNSRFTRRA